MAKVKSCVTIGEYQTYDLEVDHPDHQFYLANGVLTSNSHAVSYAFDSYFCAWLFHKYPAEWLCAWLESAEGDPNEKSKAISSVKSFGFEVAKLDINLSHRNWTITEGNKIMPSFKSVKGIGDAAINEILQNRPYESFRQLLWDTHGKWRHSKLNKKCFDVLTKLRAFESMGIVGPDQLIKNYRQLNFVIVENMAALRKHGPEALTDIIREAHELDDWTSTEKMDYLKDLAGVVSIDHIVDFEIQEKLRKNGILSMTEFLESADNGEMGIVWFVLESTALKHTSKGKEYQLFNCLNETGSSQRLFVWGAKHNRVYETNRLYMCELKKGDFVSTPAFKIKKVEL